MNKFFLQLSSAAAVSFFLASCGGGGGGGTGGAAGTAVLADSTFADCFALDVGTSYTMSDGTTRRVDEKVFNGQTLRGVTEIWGTDPDFTDYVQVGDGYIAFPGSETYGPAPMIFLSPNNRIPDNAVPGQAINLNYQETRLPANVTTTESYVTYFIGFETLTLGGKTFANTCHFRTPDEDNPGETWNIWFANGYGTIREEQQDAQGNLIGFSNKLTAVMP